ncbi:MFS transporter [Nocardiopsis gilva YIM 90087]|uniref:MFS transporter n=1 Tax=Nocardiopsis gilva YIM 90087 TaxID=1235441 RepID=A0A223SBE7_9ACTN|nr:MFS transporter [Nocardiopsis gilva]ASU85339.1 MFS transporter [Nocardiopsis gilva YIM 90087]
MSAARSGQAPAVEASSVTRGGSGSGRPGSPGAALVAAVLGFFVITLDVSGVNVALPAVREELGGSMSGIQWIADSYTLMFAALMLSAGAFSDRIGARRAYGWGLGVFTLASLACGAAPTLGTLMAARVVQGSAAAVMVPASLSLIRQGFPDPAARARGIALWTVGGAVAVAAGPVLGGLLTTEWSWRAVFFLNVPAGLAGFLVLLRAARSPRHAAAFDLPGQMTAVLALAALTFTVIEGGRDGFTGTVLAAAGVAVLSGAGFLAVEARRRTPMLPLGLFRQRGVTVPVIAGFALNAAFYGGVFVLSLFFQEERGQSALSAGLMFVPMAVITANFNYLSPRAVSRYGPRAVVVAGLLTGTLGCGGLLAVDTGTPSWVTVLLMIPLGIGGSLAMPALTSLMLESVAAERAGTAAALLNTSRQTGGALSIAVFGALLAADFIPGMRESLLLAACLLAANALGAAALLPRR